MTFLLKIFLITVFLFFTLFSQQNITGWADFKLGMNYKEVLEMIQKEIIPWIKLKGDQLSEIEEEREGYSLEILPTDFLKEGYFQFNKEKKLYLIKLVFDKKYFSFLSLMTQLTNKYGNPNKTTYKKAQWNNNNFFLELQRDRVIRYFNTSIFQKETLPKSQAESLIKENIKDILESL